MNYPEAELLRYQMEFLFSDPEDRVINPLPSRPPKQSANQTCQVSDMTGLMIKFSLFVDNF